MQFYSGEYIRQIVHKNIGGLITTPFWNYITISQYGTRIRERKSEKRKTTLQESMGARGAQTLDANFDKSFVTAVWNFAVIMISFWDYALLLNGIIRQIVHNNQAD